MGFCVTDSTRESERFVGSLLSMWGRQYQTEGERTMPEQPHRYERTLDMPPQDPWADQPTAPGPLGEVALERGGERDVEGEPQL